MQERCEERRHNCALGSHTLRTEKQRRAGASSVACLNSAGTVLIVSHQVHPGSKDSSGGGIAYRHGWQASVELDTPFMNSGMARVGDEYSGVLSAPGAHAQTCIGKATLP